MALDDPMTYLFGVAGFFLVWLLLFIFGKETRYQMLGASLITAPLGFTEYFFTQDYWYPDFYIPIIQGVGLESVLYAFCIGGIGAVVYEVLFQRFFINKTSVARPWWFSGILIVSVIGLLVGISLGYNSMIITISILLIAGGLILLLRPDLWRNALGSGLLVAGVTFVVFLGILMPFDPTLFTTWWPHSWWRVASIPSEELFFAFSWGFFAGPAYEFVHGLNRPRKSREK